MKWMTRERVKVDHIYVYCGEMVNRCKPQGAHAA
jgi:hypothetical protein